MMTWKPVGRGASPAPHSLPTTRFASRTETDALHHRALRPVPRDVRLMAGECRGDVRVADGAARSERPSILASKRYVSAIECIFTFLSQIASLGLAHLGPSCTLEQVAGWLGADLGADCSLVGSTTGVTSRQMRWMDRHRVGGGSYPPCHPMEEPCWHDPPDIPARDHPASP